MRTAQVTVMAVLGLVGLRSRAEPSYPDTSWAVVRVAPASNAKTKGRITGRVLLPAKTKGGFSVHSCGATRVADSIGISISDTDCEEVKLTPDGRFEIEVGQLGEKDSRWINVVTAPGGYLPAGVLVETAGLEIQFILVPAPKQLGP